MTKKGLVLVYNLYKHNVQGMYILLIMIQMGKAL